MISDTDQDRVINALLNAKYPHGVRSIKGIAKEAKLSEIRVEEILNSFWEFIMFTRDKAWWRISIPRYVKWSMNHELLPPQNEESGPK